MITPVKVHQPDPSPGAEAERGFVLAVLARGIDADEELAELRELARTAGVEPVAQLVQQRQRPDARTYVGKGKLEELKEAYVESGADVLLVDGELDPTQQRALENALDARVVDRTLLILDIFAQHAVSAEGKLQVELAQLEYSLPRMRGMWQHLERLGGGVGTRGPGESQLETDRRIARRRVTLLRSRLDGLSAQRTTRRKERKRAETPTVALAGYTNVGKSSLLNAMTGSTVSAANRLFHTLDPTTRVTRFDGRPYLVTDTVGFIRKLPHQLVDAFGATLEETRLADLVLHVVDASVDEDEMIAMMRAVEDVLEGIGAGDNPRLLVLNKADAIDAERRAELLRRHPDGALVSAAEGEGIEQLVERIVEDLLRRTRKVELLVPYADGGRLAELHEIAGDLQREDTPDGVRVTVRLTETTAARFAAFAVSANGAHGEGA